MVLLYMHNIGVNDYMMKVLPSLDEVVMLMYGLDVKVCGLMIGLLSMYEVLGLHMYIELVDLDLDCG